MEDHAYDLNRSFLKVVPSGTSSEFELIENVVWRLRWLSVAGHSTLIIHESVCISVHHAVIHVLQLTKPEQTKSLTIVFHMLLIAANCFLSLNTHQHTMKLTEDLSLWS